MIPAQLRAQKRITVEKYDGETGKMVGMESVTIDRNGADALADLNAARAVKGLGPVTMDEALAMARGEV